MKNQIQLLKAIDKGNGGSWYIGEYETDGVFSIATHTHFYFYDNDEFFVDIKHATGYGDVQLSHALTLGVWNGFESADKTYTFKCSIIEETGEQIVLENGEDEIYLSAKILKTFGKVTDLKFKTAGQKTPVYIQNKNTLKLLGGILPIVKR